MATASPSLVPPLLRPISSWFFNLEFQNGLKQVIGSKGYIDQQKAMFGNLNHENYLLGHGILFTIHFYLTLPKTSHLYLTLPKTSYCLLDLGFILSFIRWTRLVFSLLSRSNLGIHWHDGKNLGRKLEIWYRWGWLLHISFLRTSYTSSNWSCWIENSKWDESKRVVREKDWRRWIAGWRGNFIKKI